MAKKLDTHPSRVNRLKDLVSEFWSNWRALLLRLVLPLAILSLVFFLLANPTSLEEVALNLATDLAIIIVTVLYVDWVIKEHDRASWKRAEEYISTEAGRVANAFIRGMAVRLNLEDELYDRELARVPEEFFEDIVSKASQIDRLDLEDSLSQLDGPKWEALTLRVKAHYADATLLITQFASRMSPEELTSILEFREICSSIISYYEIIAPILVTPLPDLPADTDEDRVELIVITIINLGISFKSAIDAALKILGSFEYKLDPIPDNTEKFKESWTRWHKRSLSGRKSKN